MILRKFVLDAEKAAMLERENYYFSNHRAQDLKPFSREIRFEESVIYSQYSAQLFGNELCTMGKYSYSWSQLPRGTLVGNYCSIARGVHIMGPKHPSERFTSSSITYDRHFPIFADAIDGFEQADNPHSATPPIIGHDVWIGADCLIGHGITIGNGAVIAARSIVTKDVEPYQIVAGAPASARRSRFDQKTVEALTNTNWYEHDIKGLGIRADAPISEFINAFNEDRERGRIYEIQSPPRFVDVCLELGLL